MLFLIANLVVESNTRQAMLLLILAQKDGSDSVCGIFLDFAKAFDCVEHPILLNKLEHCEVRVNVLKLLSSYQTNTFQFILSNDGQIFSNRLLILIDVPLGSVLGLFLY